MGRGYSRRDWQALAATLLLALVLRGVLCSRLACLSRDGVQFITFARQLASDPIATMTATTKQPGFSWLLLGLHGAVNLVVDASSPFAWQRCGQTIALVGGICVCGLIFVLTRRLFDTATTAIAGIFGAVWPQGAHLSADVLSDMPHLALYLAAFLFAYRALKSDRLGWLVPSGIVAGLAYMLRQEAMGLVVAAAVCWAWPDRRRSWLRQLAGVATVALCFAAVIAPYSIATGKVLPNKNPWNLLFGTPQKLTTETSNEKDEGGRMKDEKVAEAGATAVVGSLFILHPSSFIFPSASLPARRDGDVFAGVTSWWMAPPKMIEGWAKSGRYIISTLFLLALVLKSAPRADPTGRRLAIAAVFLQLLAVQFRIKSYGEISSRYMIIPLVLCIPWAASGLLALLNVVAARLRAAWNVQSIDVRTLGTILVALPMLYYLARPINYEKAQFRHAGEWLYQHARPGDLVLAHDRLEQLMFYAGRTYPDQTWLRCSPTESVEAIRAEISQRHPQWYVDVEGGAQQRADRGSDRQATSSRAIPDLQPAWSGGASGQEVRIFHVVP
ncbi:MAG TPA: glycosyltransferase family 39 protein [Phycisphaerae bacterium]|nr:glycosyltransferase family 39 protein [Phycisphaerae bacterium]